MKKVLFLLLASIALYASTASAQEAPDSSKVKVTLHWSAKYHYDILSAMEAANAFVSTPGALSYQRQVIEATDSVYVPTKVIEVTVECGLVKYAYLLMGLQQERTYSEANAELKTILFPQIQGYTWLIRELYQIAGDNAAATDSRRTHTWAKCREAQQ